jgi:GH24 family phage-related lysozyme (muramidase)
MQAKKIPSFSNFYYLEEGVISNYINSLKSISSNVVKHLLSVSKQTLVHIATSPHPMWRVAAIIIGIWFHVLVAKGIIQFKEIQEYRRFQEKPVEYFVENPEEIKKLEDPSLLDKIKENVKIEPASSNIEQTKELEKEVSDYIDLGPFAKHNDFLSKIKYYETGGTGVPRKKYWDYNAHRDGYGTFWKEGNPEQMTDAQATKILIEELKTHIKETDYMLKTCPWIKVTDFSQKLPLIDICFNAGIKTLLDIARTSKNYNSLIKNSISSAYTKEGDKMKLNRGLVKRRLDMANMYDLSNMKEEDANKVINKYASTMDKSKPVKKIGGIPPKKNASRSSSKTS